MQQRYIHKDIVKDLKRKMVFVSCPRQAGKTSLSIQISNEYEQSLYLNHDNSSDRYNIANLKWESSLQLIIFDELHKMDKWKRWIKGIYDKKLPNQQFFVTGSARLDLYQKGGDSLLGRYHYWRLHPFTIDEQIDSISKEDLFTRLLNVGGFPEPLLLNDIQEARRWRRDKFRRVINEDIQDLYHTKDIIRLQSLVETLRIRCGQLLKLTNIAHDLEVSPSTVKIWFEIISQMYIGFPIYPYVKI